MHVVDDTHAAALTCPMYMYARIYRILRLVPQDLGFELWAGVAVIEGGFRVLLKCLLQCFQTLVA